MSHLTLSELRSFPIPTGTLTVWWLGQSGYFLKSPRGKLVVIDPYLSNACKEENGDRYGTTADRRIPAPMRPDDLVGVDLYALTHSHLDHMDPPTISSYREAGGAGPYLAPPETCERLQEQFGIPAEQIRMTWPNKSRLDLNRNVRNRIRCGRHVARRLPGLAGKWSYVLFHR